jgi:hypothetical protein
MEKTFRQLMDDLEHIDAGHIKKSTLKGFDRHKRNLHHEESWVAEGGQPGTRNVPVAPKAQAATPAPGDKKWPATVPEIIAFQRANPPLVPDGLIGKKTLAVLTQQGYTPPDGFKPVADRAGATSAAADTSPSPAAGTGPQKLSDTDIDDLRQQQIDQGGGLNMPAKGDFRGLKGQGRMPPGEMPPGAKPWKNNPELQYTYNGKFYDLNSGWTIDPDSPDLAPGEKEREIARTTDVYGNREGSYEKIDVCPVQSNPGIPSGGNPNDMDRINKAFGRGMRLGATWDYKGAAISLWYRPEGGKGRMYYDLSTLQGIMGDWAGGFKQAGFTMTSLNLLSTIKNSLGNAVGEEFTLVNAQGQQLHGAGTVQQVAFKTADGKQGYATVDFSFLGPESAWQSGGKEAWQNAFMTATLAPGLTGFEPVKAKKQIYKPD